MTVRSSIVALVIVLASAAAVAAQSVTATRMPDTRTALAPTDDDVAPSRSSAGSLAVQSFPTGGQRRCCTRTRIVIGAIVGAGIGLVFSQMGGDGCCSGVKTLKWTAALAGVGAAIGAFRNRDQSIDPDPSDAYPDVKNEVNWHSLGSSTGRGITFRAPRLRAGSFSLLRGTSIQPSSEHAQPN